MQRREAVDRESVFSIFNLKLSLGLSFSDSCIHSQK